MPGAVAVARPAARPEDRHPLDRVRRSSTRSAATRAGRVEVPAPPPQPRTAGRRRRGRPRTARTGRPSRRRTTRAARSARRSRRGPSGVTGASKLQLTVQLDPPDDGDAWLLRTLTNDGRRKDENVEAAMSRANHDRKEAIKRELERLEGLYLPLRRSQGHPPRPGHPEPERGVAADDRDRVRRWSPPGSRSASRRCRRRRRPPSLRVTSEPAGTRPPSAPSSCRTCAGRRCSTTSSCPPRTSGGCRPESRPLVKSHGTLGRGRPRRPRGGGRRARRTRRQQTKLSGADMLRMRARPRRHRARPAGLGRPARAGPPTCCAAPARSPSTRRPRLEGFEGELRSYQADALAWLGVPRRRRARRLPRPRHGPRQDPDAARPPRAGTARAAPALVIAPPAVVGNWAAEAKRFVPELRVMVHHGVVPRRRTTSSPPRSPTPTCC